MKFNTGVIFNFKLYFLLLLTAGLLIKSFEFTFFISLSTIVLIILLTKNLVSKDLINLITVLVIPLLIAATVGIFTKQSEYDYFKDIAYLTKPILFIFIGYITARKIDDKSFIFKTIILTGFIFSVLHLMKVLKYIITTNGFSINGLRGFAGLGNEVELIAICLIILNIKKKIIDLKHRNLMLVIIGTSLIFYFSRTTAFTFFLVLMAILGYMKLTKKGLKYSFFLLFAIASIYSYLFSIDIPRNSDNPIDSFLYKLKIAPSEVFLSKGGLDINDHGKLWDSWRAYESSVAIKQVVSEPAINILFGLGAGSLIDLGFFAPLSDNNSDGMRYISILHNGYVYIFCKSGVIGLTFYIIFLIKILSTFGMKNKNLFTSNILFGLGIYFLLSSFVIAGIYNLHDPLSLLIGAYLRNFEIEKNENRNMRHLRDSS